jgi:NADH dehydrogenase
VEAADRLLPSYPARLSGEAKRAVMNLGVDVRVEASVISVDPGFVILEKNGVTESIPCRTTLWAAGVGSSPFGEILARRMGCALENGRVVVNDDLTIPAHKNVFVVGDLSAHPAQLHGVAQVAIQGGQHAAKSILQDRRSPFRYRDKGNMSVIGRNSAVAQIGKIQVSGFIAWFIWAFVHIAYLIGFQNKVLVMFQWAWNYWFFNRSARLITFSRDP